MNFLAWNVNWRDLLDILVVWVFLFYFLLAVRGTRAVQILQGVVVLLVFQALSYYLKLQAIYFVLRALVLSIAVALPIVFQPELRRGLMQLGARSIISPFQNVSRDLLVKIIDEVAWAASLLSQTRYGALVVIERETGLEEFLEDAILINGEISSKLLISIFNPRSPLHDGACILRGDKVIAASCYLPLSETPPAYKHRSYGTRHRAALGLSEQTDAIVVVVSEETGGISVAKDGKLISDIPEETLKKVLLAYCAPAARATPPSLLGNAASTMMQLKARATRLWRMTALATTRMRRRKPDIRPRDVGALTHPAGEMSMPVPVQDVLAPEHPLGEAWEVRETLETASLNPSPLLESGPLDLHADDLVAEAQRRNVDMRALEAARRKAEETRRTAELERRSEDSRPAAGDSGDLGEGGLPRGGR